MAAQPASISAWLWWSQSHMSKRHVFFVGGSHGLVDCDRPVGHTPLELVGTGVVWVVGGIVLPLQADLVGWIRWLCLAGLTKVNSGG